MRCQSYQSYPEFLKNSLFFYHNTLLKPKRKIEITVIASFTPKSLLFYVTISN
jgi:hypothetical protein